MTYDDITGFWIPDVEQKAVEYDDITGFRIEEYQDRRTDDNHRLPNYIGD